MPSCSDCAEQDGFDGTCHVKGKYTTPDTPACELFFASNAAELKGLRVLNRELRVENVKLRELVALQSEFAKMTCSPTKCKRYDEYCGFGVDEECHYEHEIYDRMQELGIEVPE